MSVSPILTQGIGSFGGARYLPTLGFGTAGVVTYPYSIFLVGNIQRDVMITGASQRNTLGTGSIQRSVVGVSNVQRNVAGTGNAQRNIGLNGNVGAD